MVMFSKIKVNTIYMILAILCLIILLYLFKPKTNFDACYDKCLSSLPGNCYISKFDKVYKSLYGSLPSGDKCINKENYCVTVCSKK